MQDPPPAACAYDTATQDQLIAGCNPWDNRQAGDFMILWDQQGGSLDLFLRTWSGTGNNLTLSAPSQLNSTVSQAAYSADGFRGEAAVNLTDTDLRRQHGVPGVRQHHPEHRDRQLGHGRLQGHDPPDGAADLEL